MARVGPDKLTAERAQTILDALRRVQSFEAACALAGIVTASLWRWLRLGRRDVERGEPSDYAAFYGQVESTLAVFEAEMVAVIRDACASDWRAAAHLLAVRFPLRWSRRALDREEVQAQADFAAQIQEVAAECDVDPRALERETRRLLAEARARERS